MLTRVKRCAAAAAVGAFVTAVAWWVGETFTAPGSRDPLIGLILSILSFPGALVALPFLGRGHPDLIQVVALHAGTFVFYSVFTLCLLEWLNAKLSESDGS